MPGHDPAKGTPMHVGLLTRAGRAVRYALTGQAPDDWFGPGAPMEPMAPPEVAGRQFQYPVGYNFRVQPRGDERVSFAQLRALADAHDMTRLCIETRKDQMAKLTFRVAKRVTSEQPLGAPDEHDATARGIEAQLAYPDRRHDWTTWLRMLLEDVFVIDAPAVYVHRTRGGGVFSLDPIDGATIKPLLDPGGRTPLPPDPAYEQYLYGIPAVNYAALGADANGAVPFTADELLYVPRNPRTNKVYGCSIVEQIVLTVNVALRRQMHQLDYYTAGNIPDAFLAVPESWTATQIEQFQKYWDVLMTPNGLMGAEEKRKLKVIPGGQITQTHTAALFDEGDEWLARVVCYAFSLPPTPFVKQMNRATAATAQEASLEEGLSPFMEWVKKFMDRIIQVAMREPAYEFVWTWQQDIDPLVQHQIDDLDIKNGSGIVNEIRKRRGQPAIPGYDVPTPINTLVAPVGDDEAVSGDVGDGGTESPLAVSAGTQVPKGPVDGTTAGAAEKAAAAPRRGRSLWRY